MTDKRSAPIEPEIQGRVVGDLIENLSRKEWSGEVKILLERGRIKADAVHLHEYRRISVGQREEEPRSGK